MSERRITFFPAGCDLYNPDGRQVVLAGEDTPFQEVAGASGFNLAPIEILEDTTPGVPGSRYNSTVRLPRNPEYRFACRSTDPDAFRRAIERVSAAMDVDGPGTLLVESDIGTPAGTARYLVCSYVSGLEGDPMLQLGRAARFWGFTLKFRAFDPYWYSTDPATARWTGRPARRLFDQTWTAARPFLVDPMGVINVVPLELDGDMESYPSFVLGAPIPIPAAPAQSYAGPWSRVRFRNDRTGEFWEINRDGNQRRAETLIVQTDPKRTPSVRNLAGENRWGFTYGSSLFSLMPGDTMTVECDGCTDETILDVSVPQAWRAE